MPATSDRGAFCVCACAAQPYSRTQKANNAMTRQLLNDKEASPASVPLPFRQHRDREGAARTRGRRSLTVAVPIRAAHSCTRLHDGLSSHLFVCGQTAFCCFQRRKSAAFLFDQVIL